MKKIVIAISREYGSGGRFIGEKLALELGIPFYDRELITMASEHSGLSPEFIDTLEERSSQSFLFNLATTAYMGASAYAQFDVPVDQKAYNAQTAIIRDLADKGSCVIVGRCSDYILRDHPDCVRVFIYSSMEDKIHRVVEYYNVAPEKAKEKITKTNKHRANYHKNFTNEKWGTPASHDICINTAAVGVDGAVKILKSFIEAAQAEAEKNA